MPNVQIMDNVTMPPESVIALMVTDQVMEMEMLGQEVIVDTSTHSPRPMTSMGLLSLLDVHMK